MPKKKKKKKTDGLPRSSGLHQVDEDTDTVDDLIMVFLVIALLANVIALLGMVLT